MEVSTNLVPVRIDASSSDGAVRIIDTLVLDTKCLPVSHGHPRHDGVSGLNSFASGMKDISSNNFSLSSLIDVNAAHLTESILSDAEVYGAARSSSKTFMGGRLDLLSDTKLYHQVENQIRMQLKIALTTEKKDLMTKCAPSRLETNNESRIVRIKIRLRHENIVVVDEFDYDINSSGMEGCDPVSIANSLVQDMKLPAELAPSITASIVEQIYGVSVTDSLDSFTSSAITRHAPAAFVLDTASDGTMSDFTQNMLCK